MTVLFRQMDIRQAKAQRAGPYAWRTAADMPWRMDEVGLLDRSDYDQQIADGDWPR